MEIRRVLKTESGLVTGLFDRYRIFYQQPSDPALAERYINERLGKNESVIFVALRQVDEQLIPVGFTQLYPKYSSISAVKNWILNDLYVDNAYRKQGIGGSLINTAMDFAKNEGAAYLQLETAVDNFTAQSLYERIGFIRQAPEEKYLMYRIGV